MLKSKLCSPLAASLATVVVIFASCQRTARPQAGTPGSSPVGTAGTASASASTSSADRLIGQHAQRMIDEGRQIFRYDTFGDEAFWGDALQLHKAIAGAKNGGVGDGVSPKTALSVGLKVDADALPDALKQQIKDGTANLDDPSTTLAPNLKPFTDLLGVDAATVKKALGLWGPGRFDAILDKDGKAFRPDGKQAATLIPPAFGLAGINLHTWTGWGSVPYWNAFVGVTDMHGSGTFFDMRLADKMQFPVAAKSGAYNTRGTPDRISSKLAALHFYQLAIPAPTPPVGSYAEDAAARGKTVFEGKGKCATCHVPPLFTEPGYNLHTPAEVGVDSFQADRSPTHMYRTAPLAGLWAHTKGGFYHDGRFATLKDVVAHYTTLLKLTLSDREQDDLIEYLKSL